MSAFGSNPGNLGAWIYRPPSLMHGAPLVVVIHGCTQTAADYDRGAGWSKAADEHGFALLFPEQRRGNNPNLCFNWFSPRDARRNRGEALSIVQMVEAMHERHGTDPSRVFVTGLSAGGAMAAVMLATYPDIFAGGAVIAGLPFGTANNVPQALERMRGQEIPEGVKLGNLARSASKFSGPWPSLSVWHGTNDATVDPSNARAIVDQWRDLHGAGEVPCQTDVIEGHFRYVWCDPSGREVIEEYQIRGMGHGTPLSTLGIESREVAGPHMLEAGVSSTQLIIRFWGLAANEVGSLAPSAASQQSKARLDLRAEERSSQRAPDSITRTIEDALRAAGLLR